MKIVLLDAGPLGILANPGNSPLGFQFSLFFPAENWQDIQ